jgi:hypothetical protein
MVIGIKWDADSNSMESVLGFNAEADVKEIAKSYQAKKVEPMFRKHPER